MKKLLCLILGLLLLVTPAVAQEEKGKELLIRLDELINKAEKLAESGENPTKVLDECYDIIEELKELGYDVTYYENKIYKIRKTYVSKLMEELESLLESAKEKAKYGENPKPILEDCWAIIDELRDMGYDTTQYENEISTIEEIYSENSATTPVTTVTVLPPSPTVTITVTPTEVVTVTPTVSELKELTINVEPKTVKAKGGDTVKFRIKVDWKPEDWRGSIKFKIILSAGGFSKTFETPPLDVTTNPPIKQEFPVTLPKNLPPMTYNVKIIAIADGQKAEDNVSIVYQTPGFEVIFGAIAISSALLLRRKS